MEYVKFLFKALTIYFGEKKRFNCKKNYRYVKLANFWLNNISKINCKILIVLSYTSSGFGSRKI